MNSKAVCSLYDPGMRPTTGNFPIRNMATTKGKEGPQRREVVVFLLYATDFYGEGMTLEFYCSENALVTLMHKVINLKINA